MLLETIAWLTVEVKHSDYPTQSRRLTLFHNRLKEATKDLHTHSACECGSGSNGREVARPGHSQYFLPSYLPLFNMLLSKLCEPACYLSWLYSFTLTGEVGQCSPSLSYS